MKIVARTARQILREMTPDDAPGMFEMDADPEVQRYTGDTPKESVAELRAFLERYASVYRDEGVGRWSAVDAATGELLGWCGLRRQPDGEIDLGYRYRRAAWGRGLATEASRASLAIGFGEHGLRSVIALAHPDNVASIRVMQKAGLVYEGPSSFAGEPAVLYRIRAEVWRG